MSKRKPRPAKAKMLKVAIDNDGDIGVRIDMSPVTTRGFAVTAILVPHEARRIAYRLLEMAEWKDEQYAKRKGARG